MKNYAVNLTMIDRMILSSYEIVLEGLADYLGKGYELVLHSLENLDRSVIKIINGHYTGRKKGAPITNLALSMLAKIEADGQQEYSSYFTHNQKGEPIKATTIIIRGERNRVIGLICLNFYLNTSVHDVIAGFLPAEDRERTFESEAFVENINDLIYAAVQKTQLEVEADHHVLPSLKNKEIITRLYGQGIFELKEAVLKVAHLLNLSKNTVYMHLRNLRALEQTNK